MVDQDHENESRDGAPPAEDRTDGASFLDRFMDSLVPDAHPERVGRYRIHEILGEGGMGVVYLASQTEPVRRKVALKLIKLGMDTREVIARFEQERQALALMDHPNIARVLDAGATEDGRPYFVMEHVKGLPLTEYCDRHRLTVRERLALFMQACHGVQHAHHKGIIHRDLKPTNILVSSTGEELVAKIIDFGVAKATNQHLTERTIYTELGRIVGTPAYMSPEQANATAEDIDSRTDIYSLGVVLYELLVGVPPFDPQDLQRAGYDAMQRVIREQDPLSPSVRLSGLGDTSLQVAGLRKTGAQALTREIRGDLDWITLKALEKDRTRRFATASEFAADISRHLQNEAVMAGPPGAAYRLSKLLRKHKGPVAAVSSLIAVLAVGLAVSLVLLSEVSSARKAAKQNLEEVLRLSDIQAVTDLTTRAERLQPPYSTGDFREMEEWIASARELAARLDGHRKVLADLREGAKPPPAASWTFADQETQWRHDTLAKLVAKLEDLLEPRGGLAADMERRLSSGRETFRRTIEDARAAWSRAIASISDPKECPRYGGLEISPQYGLVPIGRDPESGLWEFGHPETGDAPGRGEDGRLILNEETGLVFVLIPAGTLSFTQWAGMHFDEPEVDRDGPDFKPGEHWNKGVLRKAHPAIAAFFLSKYETTQGQWLRVAGRNPSYYSPERDERFSLLYPVDSVNWKACEEILGRLGLALPTAYQWEYAAKGASEFGFLDTTRLIPKRHPDRVGSEPPNELGLHDMIGNVYEWCAYSPPTGTPTVVHYVRGGSWDRKKESFAPVVALDSYQLGLAEGDFGVRPARGVLTPARD
jgi:serine/threonine protein kinase